MTTYNSKSTQLLEKRPSTRSLTALAFGVAYACLVLSSVVPAQEVKKPPAVGPAHQAEPSVSDEGSVVYVVAKVQEEKKKVTDEVGQATANANDLSTKQSQAEEKRDNVLKEFEALRHSDEFRQLIKDQQAYDSACAGRQMSPDEYARCHSWVLSNDARTDRMNGRGDAYMAQYKTQVAIVQQLANEQVLAMAKITKLKNYLSWLTVADVKLSESIVKDCKNVRDNATIEELKHRCGNIQFDAANVALPACTTERCERWVMYAKPQRTPEQAIEDYKKSGKASPTPNPGLDKTNVPPPPK